MSDVHSPQQRSFNMSRIRGRDTKPELLVRSHLHRLGFRFRLNVRELPGKPDIVLPKYRTVVFVHGCFWHRHPGCRYATIPKHNAEFWEKKFKRTQERDSEAEKKLKTLGWGVQILWECSIRADLSGTIHQLAASLDLAKISR